MTQNLTIFVFKNPEDDGPGIAYAFAGSPTEQQMIRYIVREMRGEDSQDDLPADEWTTEKSFREDYEWDIQRQNFLIEVGQ